MPVLSPSILAADFARLGDDVLAAESAGVSSLHIDVMDGVLVPSISFGFPVIESLRKITDMFFDVHLMITDPDRYIERFAKAGADLLTVHIEACKDLDKTLSDIRALGVKSGIALHPETKIEDIFPHLANADRVIVMTVHTGFGGQKYLEECTDKIKKLRAYIDQNGYKTKIAVDGGVTPMNVDKIIGYGADVIVSGSSVFNGDIVENVKRFNKIMGE
ncbi:MAG TPA: ribulose-phosphate 3-epimerase [Lachnospiraceae bacterium]|nr:ribulose-phosphate 3-epimerase [Lachnospiraceae bacterium]